MSQEASRTTVRTTIRIRPEDKPVLEWLTKQFGLKSLTDMEHTLLRYASTPEGSRSIREFMVQEFTKAMKPESIFPLVEFHADR